MLVQANLSEHKVNASEIQDKLFKCLDNIFHYLFYCYNLHITAQMH